MTPLIGLSLPALLSERIIPGADPVFETACAAAAAGEDAGALFWQAEPGDTLEAALLLAPEERLETALTALFAAQQALTDAIGAIGPPEIAAQWIWPDIFTLNRAQAGRLRVLASSDDLDDEPDWLALGLSLRLRRADTEERAALLTETSFAEEGLGDLSANDVLEAWARHTLRWIYHREQDGLRPLAEAWQARAVGYRELVRVAGADAPRRMLGLDEVGGLLLHSDEDGAEARQLAEALRRGALDDVAPYYAVAEKRDIGDAE